MASEIGQRFGSPTERNLWAAIVRIKPAVLRDLERERVIKRIRVDFAHQLCPLAYEVHSFTDTGYISTRQQAAEEWEFVFIDPMAVDENVYRVVGEMCEISMEFKVSGYLSPSSRYIRREFMHRSRRRPAA